MVGVSCLLASALAGPASGGGELDRTGIRWSLPFTAAQERATAEHRLLLIKPIAFGTEKSGGW